MAKRASGLAIRVLGSVCVERGGERLELPPSKKTRALLGYLLVEGKDQSREHLCSLFWDLPDDPRGALRWSLSRLRPLLDGPSEARVAADRDQVRIDLLGASLDLRAAQAIDAQKAPVGELRAAVDLFRGELLEGLELPDAFRFQSWCTARREEARRLHATLLRALAARLPPEEALQPARKLVELDPSDEEAHRQVMALLARLGRSKDAVAQYDALRDVLRSDGTRPSPETERVRVSLPSRAEIAAPGLPPMVGRAAERAEVAAAQGVALILGEPGIGKTRLLDELAARGGVRARCYEAELGRPYGCIIEALRSSGLARRAGEVLRRDLAALLSELAPSPEGMDRPRLYDAVAALLRGAAPVLLLIDDLQWIDEASASLLHFLSRTADGVRLVISARRGELADNAAALRLVRALRKEKALTEVQLGPLDAAAVGELLRSRGLGADAAQVHRESAGNPLLALELGRAHAEGRPALSGGLLESLEQRIDAFDLSSRTLLEWTAVLGSAGAPALLARLTGRTEADVMEACAGLERHGLLSVQETGIDFAHDLMRDAALRTIAPARRKHLHAALARVLWEEPRQAGAAARQALLGGEDALAVRASVEAAGQAMRVFAEQEALALAQQAVPLLPALPREERLRAELQLLTIRVHTDRRPSRLADCARELSRLVLEGEASGLSDVVADALHLSSTAHYFSEDEQRSVSGSLRAVAAARANPDPLVRARALAQAARCLAQAELEIDRIGPLLDEAVAAAQSAHASVLDVVLGKGLLAAFLGRDAEAQEQLELAATLSQEAGDAWRATEALFALCRLALERADPAGALRAAQAVLPIAAKMRGGDEPFRAQAFFALARQLGGDGDDGTFTLALDQLRAHESRWQIAQLLILRGELELRAGRLDRAAEVIAEVTRAGDGAAQLRRGRAHVLAAELALARGDRATARAQLALALSAPGGMGARLKQRIADAAARAASPTGGSDAELRRRA